MACQGRSGTLHMFRTSPIHDTESFENALFVLREPGDLSPPCATFVREIPQLHSVQNTSEMIVRWQVERTRRRDPKVIPPNAHLPLVLPRMCPRLSTPLGHDERTSSTMEPAHTTARNTVTLEQHCVHTEPLSTTAVTIPHCPHSGALPSQWSCLLSALPSQWSCPNSPALKWICHPPALPSGTLHTELPPTSTVELPPTSCHNQHSGAARSSTAASCTPPQHHWSCLHLAPPRHCTASHCVWSCSPIVDCRVPSRLSRRSPMSSSLLCRALSVCLLWSLLF